MSEFMKDDGGKTEWRQLPWQALTELARVSTYGSKKYGRGNWRGCEDENRFLDALMRHVTKYMTGERFAHDSNLHHLAHAAWNALAILEMEIEDTKHAFDEID